MGFSARRMGPALLAGLTVVVVGVSVVAVPLGLFRALFSAPSGESQTAGSSGTAGFDLLPGERLLPGGVSSLLFGINETYDYSDHNLENTPSAQQTLKATGFTLVRTFISAGNNGWPYDHAMTTDDDLERRFQAIENVGATCLGVLDLGDDPSATLQFMDHVLTYAETSKSGKIRCRLWEYGNEPYTDVSMDTYVQRWSHDIAYLRLRHPEARFIGWVDSGPYPDRLQAFLEGVKRMGVLPDAVSYHDYPCYNDPDYADTASDAQACDATTQHGGDYADTIREMKQVIRQTLGRDLPLGITEWNVSPSFVNLVNGRLPLTVSPRYQPHFIQEMYAAMAAAHLDFAAEFDAMSGAGVGGTATMPSGEVELSLDLIQYDGTPRPWISAYQRTIAAYESGRA